MKIIPYNYLQHSVFHRASSAAIGVQICQGDEPTTVDAWTNPAPVVTKNGAKNPSISDGEIATVPGVGFRKHPQ